jgi:hypothetical protein
MLGGKIKQNLNKKQANVNEILHFLRIFALNRAAFRQRIANLRGEKYDSKGIFYRDTATSFPLSL